VVLKVNKRRREIGLGHVPGGLSNGAHGRGQLRDGAAVETVGELDQGRAPSSFPARRRTLDQGREGLHHGFAGILGGGTRLRLGDDRTQEIAVRIRRAPSSSGLLPGR
jgi:hypothetical protein